MQHHSSGHCLCRRTGKAEPWVRRLTGVEAGTVTQEGGTVRTCTLGYFGNLSSGTEPGIHFRLGPELQFWVSVSQGLPMFQGCTADFLLPGTVTRALQGVHGKSSPFSVFPQMVMLRDHSGWTPVCFLFPSAPGPSTRSWLIPAGVGGRTPRTKSLPQSTSRETPLFRPKTLLGLCEHWASGST